MDANTAPTPEDEKEVISKPKCTKYEYDARVQLVMQWICDGAKGKQLMLAIRKEFGVSEPQAYNYIKDAQELEEKLVNLSIPELRKLVKAKYLRFTNSRDKKIALQATDRLAKHASFFPNEKLDVTTTNYDNLSLDEIEALAKKEGIE